MEQPQHVAVEVVEVHLARPETVAQVALVVVELEHAIMVVVVQLEPQIPVVVAAVVAAPTELVGPVEQES
jgi:hypothetical protein